MLTTVTVHLKRNTDDSYPITIGMPLSLAARDVIRREFGSRYFVITDSNVARLYGSTFVRMLRSFGKKAALITVPAGERSKNRKCKERIENDLLSMHAGRDSVIVALGGGMIGDLAGFVAATVQRGVPLVQIPTTLLAQVDSSVGGKVAVDHPLGKNLIGAFYQPKKVYIDLSTLSTLSDKEFVNGLAEVIKYAAIMDRRLFAYLEQHRAAILHRSLRTLRLIVGRCCELKKEVVQTDEKEESFRRILNFGHTVGHALESLSHYRMPHGAAVAVGMSVEARFAVLLNLLSPDHYLRLVNLIAGYGLPTDIPSGTDVRELIQATLHDKKARNGSVHYTLLEEIGTGRIGMKLTPQKARQLLLR